MHDLRHRSLVVVAAAAATAAAAAAATAAAAAAAAAAATAAAAAAAAGAAIAAFVNNERANNERAINERVFKMASGSEPKSPATSVKSTPEKKQPVPPYDLNSLILRLLDVGDAKKGMTKTIMSREIEVVCRKYFLFARFSFAFSL